MYRRYEWSRPEMQEILKSYIPVMVEHRTWQESIPHPERDFPGFIARAGMELYEPAEGHGSIDLVGLFALTPDGSRLHPSLTTTESPEAVLSPFEFLQAGLKSWDALPLSEVGFEAANPDFERANWRWSSAIAIPAQARDSVVLQSWTRDLPRTEERSDPIKRKAWMAGAWNSDFLWIEDPEFLIPEHPEEGRNYALPGWWTKRLVQYHLVDNVAGLTKPFPASAIERADVFLKTERVSKNRVSFELVGKTRAVERGRWKLSPPSQEVETERGFETEILGRVVWDRERSEFLEFNFVAIGTRWGGTGENRRWEVEFPPAHNDLAPAPVGVAFRLFRKGPKEAIPPFFAWSERADGYFGRWNDEGRVG
jgi:hypothetical protein